MQNALRATAERDKDRFRDQIAAAVVGIADGYYRLCRGHRDKTLDWANYLNKCSEVLKALDFAYNLASEKRPIVKRIIDRASKFTTSTTGPTRRQGTAECLRQFRARRESRASA